MREARPAKAASAPRPPKPGKPGKPPKRFEKKAKPGPGMEGRKRAGGAPRLGKRGRPKGAENLSSRQLREMLIRAGGHPLIHLARWATMTPEEMARRLDCKVVEAFDRQVAIWDKLAPYVAAKLAPTDEKGNAVPGLVISIGDQAINAGIGVSAGGSPPWLAAYRDAEGRIIDGVEIQGVSGSRAERADQEGGS